MKDAFDCARAEVKTAKHFDDATSKEDKIRPKFCTLLGGSNYGHAIRG
jgi:hypothetical protein